MAEQIGHGIVEVAQAAPGTVGQPIGQVETLTGGVVAIRSDGTRVDLEAGDSVYQGDTLESGADGSIGIVLADQTTFSMAENGSMVLDEMVYDPGNQEGSVSLSVLQGVFTFVSGEIAKTDPDAMTLDTPLATIGIRGTQLAMSLDPTDSGGDGLKVVLDVTTTVEQALEERRSLAASEKETSAATSRTHTPSISPSFLHLSSLSPSFHPPLSIFLMWQVGLHLALQAPRGADGAPADVARRDLAGAHPSLPSTPSPPPLLPSPHTLPSPHASSSHAAGAHPGGGCAAVRAALRAARRAGGQPPALVTAW